MRLSIAVKTTLMLSASCVSASMLPGVAAAQDASDEPTLAEIVVTAQKRSENLQDVPIAISAFTAEALGERNVSDVATIGKLSPNVNLDSGAFTSSSSVLSAFIRGIGQSDFSINFDPGVGVYVDGVYLGRTAGANLGLSDVERIEVLKGPQGTLFGRNTIGGAVNIVTASPTKELAFTGELTAGSYNRLDFRGMVSGPVSDTLSASLAFATKNRDGYVKRIPFDTTGYLIDSTYFIPRVASSDREGGMGEYTLRGKLQWEPSDTITSTLSVDYTHIKTSNMPFTLLRAGSGPFADVYNGCISLDTATLAAIGLGAVCGPRAVVGTALGGANADADPNNNRLLWGPQFVTGDIDTTYATGNSQERTEVFGAANTLSWDIADEMTLRSITAYRELHYNPAADFDGSPLEYLEAKDNMDQKQFSQEFQLVGTAMEKKLKYLFGAYYYNEVASEKQLVTLANLVFFNSQTKFKTRALALFTNISYQLTDSLGLTIGARYTKERKRAFIDQKDENAVLLYKLTGCFPVSELCRVALGYPDASAPLNFLPLQETQQNFENFSPRIAVDYKVNDNIMLYASWAKGYKSGGWTARVTAPLPAIPTFGPEKATTWEAGFKSELFDRRVRLNMAAFTTKYAGLQVNFLRGVSPTIENAGDARIKGFEGELTAVLTDQFTLTASVGYLDAYYTRVEPGADITINSELQKTPKWSFGVSPRFEVPVGANGSFIALVDYSYRSRVANDAPNTPLIYRNAANDLSASLTYKPNERLRFTAGGTNLLNDRYLVSGVDQAATGFTHGTYNRPPEWYAQIGVTF